MTTVGVIRVLTTFDPELLNAHGRALEAEYGFSVISRCIPDQPSGVHSPDTYAQSVPKVEALASELSNEVDAIIVSCAADPGLEEARLAVGVPVVGAGSAAATLALTLGASIGVLDLTPTTPVAITRILGNRLIASVTPDGVNETRHLLTPEGRLATVYAAEKLIAAGADVILLACTGMTSIGVAADLEQRFHVPVVDAVLAAGAAVAQLSNSFTTEGQ